MPLEPTLDEIQKLLMLIKFLGMQGLSLAIGPLVGAEGSIPKAMQKQSQVERLRKELDEQISRYLAARSPDASEVRVLMLIARLGNGIDAMAREVIPIGELARGMAPSSPVARQMLALFEAGCEMLNHSVTALFELGTPAAEKTLRKSREQGIRLTGLLEQSRQAGEGGAAWIAAVSRVALHAHAASEEIVTFLAAYALQKSFSFGTESDAAPDFNDRVRLGRS